MNSLKLVWGIACLGLTILYLGQLGRLTLELIRFEDNSTLEYLSYLRFFPIVLTLIFIVLEKSKGYTFVPSWYKVAAVSLFISTIIVSTNLFRQNLISFEVKIQGGNSLTIFNKIKKSGVEADIAELGESNIRVTCLRKHESLVQDIIRQ